MKLHYVFLAVAFMAFLYTGSASNSVKANRKFFKLHIKLIKKFGATF